MKYCIFEDIIIVNRFSSIIKRLLNYFICVNRRSDFWFILSLICKFCALTLLHKYRIKSVAKIFKKYGKNFRGKNKFNQNILELAYSKTLKTNTLFKFKGAIQYV